MSVLSIKEFVIVVYVEAAIPFLVISNLLAMTMKSNNRVYSVNRRTCVFVMAVAIESVPLRSNLSSSLATWLRVNIATLALLAHLALDFEDNLLSRSRGAHPGVDWSNQVRIYDYLVREIHLHHVSRLWPKRQSMSQQPLYGEFFSMYSPFDCPVDDLLRFMQSKHKP